MFKGGPLNIDLKALLELAKVVIVLLILFGSYACLPGNQTFGCPQSILYKLDFQYLI